MMRKGRGKTRKMRKRYQKGEEDEEGVMILAMGTLWFIFKNVLRENFFGNYSYFFVLMARLLTLPSGHNLWWEKMSKKLD